MSGNRLVVKNFTFSFPDENLPLWTNLNFNLNPGEVLGITGPSGCGKSTLCYCLSGIIPRHLPGNIIGEILVDEQPLSSIPLPRLSQKIGMVFQDPETQLFCTTVEEEIAFGPENLCLPPEEIEQRIKEVLELTGMTQYRYTNPGRLSGGEKQLLALGSVLALRPHTLILDEALSQLDRAGRQRVQEIILPLKKAGKSLILVDHQLENLVASDRLLHLENGKACWS